MKILLKYIVAVAVALAGFTATCHAQFKEEAFQQTYNEEGTYNPRDTADRLFSFKEYIGGLSHKNTIKPGVMFAGSVILPGTAQIYNKDYWKLPIVYGGIGALAGTGGYYLHQYKSQKKAYTVWETNKIHYEETYGSAYPRVAPEFNPQYKTRATWLLAGAGLLYWGSLLDGVVCYESTKYPDPGKATLYSVLLPGLGQIYNGELYKVPIYWGGLMISTHMLMNNNRNYKRFKRIHNEATNPDIEYSVPISGETAKWYRDVYRRYRDYSIVATALLYVLQVMDANVFAYMHDFEVTDDISMSVEPAVICPYNAYAINTAPSGATNSFGLRVGFTF
ncbi:MAG: hypothetical protein IKV05_07615 [Bacteroidales bacterium]|nr:hypothetical protein [Bacteroidales bacterium]